MFRIIQWRLPKDKILESAKSDSYQVNRLQDLTDLHSGKGEFTTPPMATTSAMFFEVEQCVRSMFGDPPHLIKDLTADYTLLRTRAPVAYDYDYCIEIGTMAGKFGEERLVAVPNDRVEYQSGRYSSGMFTPIDCS